MNSHETPAKKLTPRERRNILVGIYSARIEIESFPEFARGAKNLNELITPWGIWYEFSLSRHLAALLLFMEFGDWLGEINRCEEPRREFINMLVELGEIESQELDLWADNLDAGGRATFTSLLMALTGQINAISQYSLSMSELVRRAGEGDHDSLFRAVTIDRSVVSSPTIAKQISLAQVVSDESFMNRLSKALTRTKPARPDIKLDDMRYMLEALVEGVGIESFTKAELEEILKGDLELYDNDSDYSRRAFNKLIQKRNKMVGT